MSDLGFRRYDGHHKMVDCLQGGLVVIGRGWPLFFWTTFGRDTIYVSKTYRITQTTPVIHAAALKAWGKEIPWAWPRDGRRETLEGAGKPFADQYQAQGLNMLFDHAQFDGGSVSLEAGIQDMLIRMEGGRFKVFRHLNDWWDEFRLYHHKDGKVVKEYDDLMSATRYAVMMLRYARTAQEYNSFHRKLEYPRSGYV